MKRFEEKNEALDRAGTELLKASMLTSDEIEKIVTAPYIFDSVKATIRSGQKPARPVWGWRKPAMTFAALAVLAIVAAGFIGFARQYYFSPDDVLEARKSIGPVSLGKLPQFVADFDEIDEMQTSNVKSPASDGSKRRATKTRVVKRQVQANVEHLGEFYALTYTGDTEAAVDDQVVRVDLPRSSLFAMGINVPVENEVIKVKADLLVGSDGVTKAVRLVR